MDLEQHEGIVVTLDGGVLTLTIDRPQAMNGITPSHMRFLGRTLQYVETEPEVRVIVITGAGRSFCAGADLQGMDVSDVGGAPPVTVAEADLFGQILDCSKPLIAAVNGGAAGGGLGLALACDVRVASTNARFATAFSRIGVTGNDAVPWLLPRVVGMSKALELLYGLAPIDAEEAERIGLVSYVVPPDQLASKVAELAASFAAAPPYAVRFTKRLVVDGLTRTYREHVLVQEYAQLANRTAAGHDIVEGVNAFLEKRTPQFRGPDADGPPSTTA